MQIKKIIEVNQLLDFYGYLLTDKQKIAMDLYYKEDLSFTEIANELNISRQAVYDTLKKSQEALYTYEEKLSIKKYSNQTLEFKNKTLQMLNTFLKSNKDSLSDNQKKDIQKIIKFVRSARYDI